MASVTEAKITVSNRYRVCGRNYAELHFEGWSATIFPPQRISVVRRRHKRPLKRRATP